MMTCVVCGRTGEPSHGTLIRDSGWRVTCSTECAEIYRTQEAQKRMVLRRRKVQIAKPCANCGTVFTRVNGKGGLYKFCSVVCRSEYQERTNRAYQHGYYTARRRNRDGEYE